MTLTKPQVFNRTEVISELSCIEGGSHGTPQCGCVIDREALLATDEALRTALAEAQAVVEAIGLALNGVGVSDFMESFPTVRRAMELRKSLEYEHERAERNVTWAKEERARAEAAEQQRDELQERFTILERLNLRLSDRDNDTTIALRQAEQQRDEAQREVETLKDEILRQDAKLLGPSPGREKETT